MKRALPRTWTRFARRWLKGDKAIGGRLFLLGIAFVVGLVAA
jgi:hypothetical protein